MTLPNLACYFKNATDILISENLDLLNDNSLQHVKEESLDELEMKLDSALDILNLKLMNKFEFKNNNDNANVIKNPLKRIGYKRKDNSNCNNNLKKKMINLISSIRINDLKDSIDSKDSMEESANKINDSLSTINKSVLTPSINSNISTSSGSNNTKDCGSLNNMTGLKRKNEIKISQFELLNHVNIKSKDNKPDYSKVISFLEKYS